MPDNPTEPSTQSTADIDAGWGELLDGIGHSHPVDVASSTAAPAEPEPVEEQDPCELDVAQKRSANEMLAQMARMLDVREGTGPVVDLRRALAPKLDAAPSTTPLSAPTPAPLLPARHAEPEPSSQAEIETPPAMDKLSPSERTVVTKRPRDDAPLLLEIGDDAPRPVDVRDDAPRLLPISDGVPQPIEGEESWPRRESPRPRTRSGESSAVNARVLIDTAPRPVARAARPQWPWFAGAAVLVIAIGWAVLRPAEDPSRDVVQASAAPQRSADRSGAAAAALADTRARESVEIRTAQPDAQPRSPAEPAEPAKLAEPDAAKPAEPDAAKPAEPDVAKPAQLDAPQLAEPDAAPPAEPPAAAPDASAAITGTPQELLAAADRALGETRYEEAHALARRSWEAAHDNAAVRVMALAACELRDGALARSAFRKLKGQDVRSEVYGVCRGRAVDVRSNIDGYTPAELLVKASRELDRGAYDRAYELARASNKLSHTTAAMTMMAACACHEHDADEAAHLVGMLPKARKQEVLDACKAAGTTLP